MKKLIATDPRASRFTHDPGIGPGDEFMPKDKQSAKLVKALKWARDIDVETEVKTASVSGPVADAAAAPKPPEPEGAEDAVEANDEAETVVEEDIEAVRAEYERVTGEPADKRYGAARLREEMAKHAGRSRYQRRDMQADD